LASLERVGLGSDSPITAEGDLLDEVRCARNDIGLDERTVYEMVTTNPASMLHLRDGQGRICEAGVADLIAVRSCQATPARALCEMTYAHLELVLIGGRVQMVSQDVYERLPEEWRAGLNAFDVGGHRRWIRAPLQKLIDSAEGVLGVGKLAICGRTVRSVDAL
jgi:hypothetical protein